MATATQVPADCPMTNRQFEALSLIVRGNTYKQAALKLGLSESTIGNHANLARTAIGACSVSAAVLIMVQQGWIDSDAVIGDWQGLPYATVSQRNRTHWIPSPAQRLYLDAFDRLLRERSDEAAEAVDYYFGALVREQGVPDRRRGGRDVDEMLLRLGRALVRPIAA